MQDFFLQGGGLTLHCIAFGSMFSKPEVGVSSFITNLSDKQASKERKKSDATGVV